MLRQTILYLLLIISSNILLMGQNTPATEENNNYHLLWKIEGNDLTEPSFVFGTMHVQDKRAFNYSDSVMLAIDQVDAFANEIQLDTMINQLFTQMFETDTNNLVKDLLTDEEYLELSKRVEKELGIPIDKINLSNPFFIESLLAKTNSKKSKKDKDKNKDEMNTFVDAYLLGIAKTLNKKIYGLEQIEDQLSTFTGVSREEQRAVLLKEIKSEDSLWESIVVENMLKIYEKGDLKLLEEFVGDKMINDPILIKRNKIMVKSMLQIMEKESLFAAVGAAHIPGEQGIVRLLEEKGYKVTPVTATFTGVAKTYKVDLSTMAWQPYQNEKFGVKLETPGKLIDVNLFENMTFLTYPDLSTGAFYGLMVIPANHQNVTDEYATTILKGMQENLKQGKQTILEEEIKKTSQGVALELLTETATGGIQKIIYYVANGRIIALTVGNTAEVAKSELADRFFDSFEMMPVEADAPITVNWQKITNDTAALSINLPFKPQYKRIEVPNEAEGKIWTTILHAYMCTDTESLANYIYRYNDYPIGMYMENEQDYFNFAIEDLKTRADSIIGKVDTIFKDGYEGREVNMTIQGYYCRGRFFVRGNRIYYMIHQNLNKSIQTIDNKIFLNTFQFEPYKQDVFKTETFDDLNFKIDLPSVVETTQKEELPPYLPYKNLSTIAARNPYTGGQYTQYVFEIGEYFQAENIDSFYRDNINSILIYSDSIMKEETFYINDDIYGKEVHILENTKKTPVVYRVLLHDKNLYQTFVSESAEEIDGKNQQQVFESFQLLDSKTNEKYESKTKQLLEDLSTTDTTIFKKTVAAIQYYYEFKEDEIPDVLKAINTDYPLDTGNSNIRTTLFNSISDDLKIEHIEELKEVYLTNLDYQSLPYAILPYFVYIDSLNGYNTYFDLLMNHAPSDDETALNFRPFYDSLSFTASKFPLLVERFKDDKQHKRNIMDLGTSLLDFEEGKYAEIVNKEYDKLTKNVLNTIDNYKKVLADTTDRYNSPYGVFRALRFMDVAEAKPMTNTFTNEVVQIKNPECSKWLKQEALCIRIQNKWEYDKKMCKKFLEDEDLRFDLLEALHKADQLGKSTKKYTERNAFVELSFNDYLEDTDDYKAEKVTIIDTVEKTDSLYYTVEFSYQEEEEKYIGIIGPFPKDKSKLNFETTGNTSWEQKQENPKEQANKLLEELIKWQKEAKE